MTLVFRQSEIKKFKRCPRSWWLNYRIDGSGYEAPKSDTPQTGQRDVGLLVHAALDYYYQTNGDPGAWVAQERNADQETNGPLSKEWEEVYTLARIMVTGYVQWLEQEGYDSGERTLFVEQQLEVPIGRIRGEDVVLTARIDRVIEDMLTGEPIIEDTKTVQSMDQVGLQLNVDDQGLMYCIMAKAGLKLDAHRFRHNMLRKVKRGPQAKPPFYGRHEVRYNETQLNNAWTHMMAVVDKMTEALQYGEAHHQRTMYPNPTKDCTWDCGFLAICPMMDDGSDWHDALTESGLYIQRENV